VSAQLDHSGGGGCGEVTMAEAAEPGEMTAVEGWENVWDLRRGRRPKRREGEAAGAKDPEKKPHTGDVNVPTFPRLESGGSA